VPKQQTTGVWSQGILGVKYCVHQLFGKEYAILASQEAFFFESFFKGFLREFLLFWKQKMGNRKMSNIMHDSFPT
jgi:hypothetical protein